MIYLDSNVFIIAFNPRDQRHSYAQRLLKEIEDGLNASTSVTTIDEVIYQIENVYGKDRALQVWDSMLNEPNLEIIPLTGEDMVSLKEYYEEDLDPRDCIHAHSYEKSKADFLITEDKDFNKLDKIKNFKISKFLEKWT